MRSSDLGSGRTFFVGLRGRLGGPLPGMLVSDTTGKLLPRLGREIVSKKGGGGLLLRTGEVARGGWTFCGREGEGEEGGGIAERGIMFGSVRFGSVRFGPLETASNSRWQQMSQGGASGARPLRPVAVRSALSGSLPSGLGCFGDRFGTRRGVFKNVRRKRGSGKVVAADAFNERGGGERREMEEGCGEYECSYASDAKSETLASRGRRLEQRQQHKATCPRPPPPARHIRRPAPPPYFFPSEPSSARKVDVCRPRSKASPVTSRLCCAPLSGCVFCRSPAIVGARGLALEQRRGLRLLGTNDPPARPGKKSRVERPVAPLS